MAFFGALAARLYHLQVERSADYRAAGRGQPGQPAPAGSAARPHSRPPGPAAGPQRARPTACWWSASRPATCARLLAALAALVALPAASDRCRAGRGAGLRRAFVPLLVREDLTWDEVARVAVHSPELPGVRPRFRPAARLSRRLGARPCAGLCRRRSTRPSRPRTEDPLLQLPEFRIGKSGIERSYDRVLRGRAGLSRVEVNAIGREIRELDRREGVPGADVRLALDLDLQRFCVARLSSELAASAVVVDVRSGGVLALASVPSYEPAACSPAACARASGSELRDDPRTPLVNKCIRGQYPPGSTFKMMTALAALEAGISPSYQVFCPGHHQPRPGRVPLLEGARPRLDRDGPGAGPVLRRLFLRSCPPGRRRRHRRHGDPLRARRRSSGIDLPGEQPGLIPTTAWKKATLGESWQKGETLVCGIGQGYVSATPLQLAVMAARLANGGLGGAALARGARRAGRPAAATDRGAARPSWTWCWAACARWSTAPAAPPARPIWACPGVEMAGKTGTAQVRRISRADRAAGRHKRKDIPWVERDHALFVCFAPYADPRYAVAVVVEHGHERRSKAASPIARDIMRRTLELDPAVGSGTDGHGGTA